MAHFDVHITKVKDIRGRRITGYVARLDTRLGPSALEARGKTEEEATSNLRSKLTHALNDCLNLQPEVFTFKGFTGVIYRTTIESDDKGNGQYGYRLTLPDGTVGCEHNGGTYSQIRRSCETHIAQLLYPDIDVFRLFTTQEAESDHSSWVEFQQRYAYAKAAGYSSDDCHSYALRNPARSAEWLAEVDQRIADTMNQAT